MVEPIKILKCLHRLKSLITFGVKTDKMTGVTNPVRRAPVPIIPPRIPIKPAYNRTYIKS